MSSAQQGNNIVKDLLSTSRPVMISRLGRVEAECLIQFLNNAPFSELTKNQMKNNAGFFPATDEALKNFCTDLIKHIGNMDAMAIWLNGIDRVIAEKLCPNAAQIELRSLEPYYYSNPWSSILKDKDILVIHPFEQSITTQYNKRTHLFKNPDILPDFRLHTIKAVQSSSNTSVPFSTWFDAYQHMCDKICTENFDIAIVGCGAYGLPLSSFIKSIGKKVIHMAGATQILFGIKGSRWDNHEDISKLYNGFWVRPMESERPKEAHIVEGGCYW